MKIRLWREGRLNGRTKIKRKSFKKIMEKDKKCYEKQIFLFGGRNNGDRELVYYKMSCTS